MDDTTEIIETIRKQGLFEVAEVRTFRAYLDDSNEEVEITLADSEKARTGRYTASAMVLDDPERVSAGNPENSIDRAIINIHWNELRRR